jgi:dipeptidyl aminopeptidase/acylaminoacyl peptidase
MAKRGMTPEDLLRITFVGDPQISPNGDSVLFGRKTIEKNKYVTQLFTVDDHGTLRQWTSGEHGASGGRWSPDGKQIAFVAKRGTPGPQIYLLPVDGGEARVVTKLPEGSLTGLKWSSDGKQIAFLFREALEADMKQTKRSGPTKT